MKTTKIFCIHITKDEGALEKFLLDDQVVDYQIIFQISKFLIEHIIRAIKIPRHKRIIFVILITH